MDTRMGFDPETDLERGFGVIDPWPGDSSRASRPRARTNRGINAAAILIGAGILALLAIQVFAAWFGPCLRGAC